MKLKSLFESRRFWAGAAGLLVIVAEHFGVTAEIEQQTIFNMSMLIGAWIVGDSFRKTE